EGLFSAIDSAQKGTLDKQVLTSFFGAWFERLDVDQKGILDRKTLTIGLRKLIVTSPVPNNNR
ncbi:MAG: hypothetical protein VX438_06155, partial [Planctomycetota bacterium]|nr:hypothetical protein [Planctomycetota bacterium]